VEDTAPMPGVRMPSFPLAGLISSFAPMIKLLS
jgi:hypothetical protein